MIVIEQEKISNGWVIKTYSTYMVINGKLQLVESCTYEYKK